MLELTYDRDARTLYFYFTAIEPGQDATQTDVDGQVLLDGEGQIVGLEFVTQGIVTAEALQFALGHDEAAYDEKSDTLTIWFERQEPAAQEPFPFPAIFDLDKSGNVLGAEFVADPEFELGTRLRHVEPFITEVYGDEDRDVDEQDEDTDVAPTPAAPLTVAPIASDEIVKAGFVALLGKPNVGKSTLLNAYLGQKVSIVSPKPQTTRIPVRGILNRDDAQVIFVDTPGLHTPRSSLGEYMVQAARRAIPDSDVLCLVVDASAPPSAQDQQIAQAVLRARKPAILVLNKMDIARKADVHLQAYRDLGPWDTEVAVSASTTEGVAGLLDEIIQRLPEGPRLFPAEQLTDLSEREQVAEVIREKVLLNTAEEVPHGVAIEVEEWAERGERLYIRATVNVEREGHKGIIIGEGGKMLKKIGAAARYEIERALGRPVYLDLWIKVRKNWRQDPSSLRWLGYDVNKLK
jgi:GTP-binding protein Era